MNNVQQFLNDNFGKVRVYKDEKDVIWFCSNDLMDILEYAEGSRRTKISRLPEKGVTKCNILTEGGNQQTNFVNEANMYRLVMGSKMNKAEEFQDWICETVIPAIRKDGAYISGEEKLANGEMSEEEFILKAMSMMQNKIDRLAKENEEMKPKVKYHDEVLNPTTYIKLVTTTEIAKDLSMTAQSLNKKLKEIKFIYKDKNGVWCLYKDYQHLIPEFADYKITEHGQTLKYTEKGRQYIIDLLNKSVS
jgi:prophage antirepressor-like protein